MSQMTVMGSAIAYRLFDVGYAIDLDRALDLLSSSAPQRVRPVRGEAQALQISNPPITVLLGNEMLVVGDDTREVELSARIFDFGVVSLRVRVRTPAALTWEAFTEFGLRLEHHPGIATMVAHHLRLLTERIREAIERPQIADVHEDYTVFRLTSVHDASGTPVGAEALSTLDVVPLLLNETRPLSVEARRELLPHRFTYYADDLAILTWDNALVVEPGEHDTDLQYILEFANAQLLELRFYDALLDAELPRLYDAIEAARARRSWFPGRRFAGLLSRLQGQVADSTELVERVENALKVTDDVYLARVYSAALELFRGRAWRAGIDRKLAILRDTYAMLNDESQAGRSETLEMAIVLLIVGEIVMAIFKGMTSVTKPEMEAYSRHVLVCTGAYCSENRSGRAIYSRLAALLQREGLLFGPTRVKRSEAPCLGVCGGGPIVAVYPEGVWYADVSLELLERIVVEHLKGGRVVEEAVFHRLGS